MQNNKEIILKNLIGSLDQSDFNLDAWKMKATLVLESIFSPADKRIELIHNLHYDYSSWSLRDHSGGKMNDSVKKTAAEIIDSAIVQLQLADQKSVIETVFQNELSGGQFAELMELKSNQPENQKKIKVFVNSLEDKVVKKIVAGFVKLI